ncbi:MAG TPA: GNAT family N-acetyltransferase [Kofleriaceae bacterium]|nr:GNAT family N-acetyltransferase [Kofleriaceae bacterium]
MSPSKALRVERLNEIGARSHELSALLVDCVDSGASVGFLPPVSAEEARGYWEGLTGELRSGSRALLVALVEQQVAGAVQLALCMKKNGSHRAEVEKLMVHTAHRHGGLGRALLGSVEQLARECGRTLLVLDTRTGDVASALYRKCGYVEAGQVPGYALSADGRLDATTYFYKQL